MLTTIQRLQASMDRHEPNSRVATRWLTGMPYGKNFSNKTTSRLFFAEYQNPHCTPKLANATRVTKLASYACKAETTLPDCCNSSNATLTSESEGHTRDSPWHASHRAMQLLTARVVASDAAGSDGDFFPSRLSHFAARINERRTTWKKRYQFRRGRLWKTSGRG